MSSNNVGYLIANAITTLKHFATLHHTSPNHTSLHLSTLHFLSFTLHYLLFWLNPFPFLSFYFTSHHQNRHSTVLIFKLISKTVNPFTALKNLSPFHFTSLLVYYYFFFFHLSYQPFTSLYFAIHTYNSLPFTSELTFNTSFVVSQNSC